MATAGSDYTLHSTADLFVLEVWGEDFFNLFLNSTLQKWTNVGKQLTHKT